jgi:hypothetical protein
MKKEKIFAIDYPPWLPSPWAVLPIANVKIGPLLKIVGKKDDRKTKMDRIQFFLKLNRK